MHQYSSRAFISSREGGRREGGRKGGREGGCGNEAHLRYKMGQAVLADKPKMGSIVL